VDVGPKVYQLTRSDVVVVVVVSSDVLAVSGAVEDTSVVEEITSSEVTVDSSDEVAVS
jgi:hypothetical protein